MTGNPGGRAKSGAIPLGWLAVAGVGVCCALPFLIGAVAAGSTFVVFSWLGLSSLLALGALALFISYALFHRWKGRRIAPTSASRTHGFQGKGASDGKR